MSVSRGRYQELMASIGQPNSRSVMLVLEQIVHEAEEPLTAERDQLRARVAALEAENEALVAEKTRLRAHIKFMDM